MKVLDKMETEVKHNEEKKISIKYTYDDCMVSAETVVSRLKSELFNKLNDNINLGTYYVFKLDGKVYDLPEQMRKECVLSCDYKIADSVFEKVVYYDDIALKTFKQPNKLWKRIKLAFRYIFRKEIK